MFSFRKLSGHIKTAGPLRCRISATTITVISGHLKLIRGHLPRNFARKPRSLMEYTCLSSTLWSSERK
ncbi:hypothetical protein CHARACLAT_022721 [Characodon lateralis]|uniref:Uncharacterized protein n=1 Tax=Characodon lateralis TaxID=208331 RepID=A0ABU7D935_9TELE|nr:hypothetical protein [Characodon lateralis]